MEIKKEGITPKTWRYIGICPHCQTELSIGYKDINMYAEQGFFKRKLRFTVRCCSCRNFLRLQESEIPSIIRQAIFNEMDIAERIIKLFF